MARARGYVGHSRMAPNPVSFPAPVIPCGPHQFEISDTQSRRQFEYSNDGRITLSSLKSAYILLAEARHHRKLLLCQSFFGPDALYVFPDELPHIHAVQVTGLHNLSLST